MAGIEQGLVAPAIGSDEHLLMSAFQDVALAEAAQRAAGVETDILNRTLATVREDFYNQGELGQDRDDYVRNMGEITDKMLATGLDHAEKILKTAQMRSALFDVTDEFRGRKLHILSLIPEDEEQPQPINARFYNATLETLHEAAGSVMTPSHDGSRLELAAIKPRRRGLTRFKTFAVQMVQPSGEPLVAINFVR